MSSGFTQPEQPGYAAPPPPPPPPRRISIFGGVLWIAIGGLLLANNLIGNFGVWELFWKYWPVLLILLGAAKLMDHFAVQRTGGPPAKMLSGGEVFLIILLLIVGGSIAGVREVRGRNPDFDIRFPWDLEYTWVEEASQPMKAVRPVRIDIPRGNISVIAEDGDQIRVVVNKRSRGTSEEEARERAKNSGIEIIERGDSYLIQRRQGAENWIRLDLEVHLPRKAAINARTARGSVQVQGLEADLVVDANGNLEVRDLKGNLEAKVRGDALVFGASGDVRVDGNCDDIEIADVAGGASIRCGFGGRATLRNVTKQVFFKSVRTEFRAGTLPGRMVIGPGDMEVYDAPKDVTLLTSDYDIRMENVGGSIRVENRNDKVEIRLPRPPTDEINVTNRRGGVELIIPANSAFEVSAVSDRGDVETDFSGLTVNTVGRDKRIEGRVGAGGPRVTIRSSYGDVSLRKGQ